MPAAPTVPSHKALQFMLHGALLVTALTEAAALRSVVQPAGPAPNPGRLFTRVLPWRTTTHVEAVSTEAVGARARRPPAASGVNGTAPTSSRSGERHHPPSPILPPSPARTPFPHSALPAARRALAPATQHGRGRRQERRALDACCHTQETDLSSYLRAA
jgi:hypothetical protein